MTFGADVFWGIVSALFQFFLQEEGQELFCHIDKENQQGHQSGAFDEGLALQPGNQQCQRHGAEVHQEGHGGNGNHGVDEEIAVHLHDGGYGAGDVDMEQCPHPADTQGLGHILQVGIELGQGVVGQKIGRREKVYQVYNHQNEDGAVEGHPVKGQQVGKTQHHAGDGQGQHAHKVEHLSGDGLAGPGGGVGGKVRKAGAHQGCQQGNGHGVDEVHSHTALQKLSEGVQGEGHIDGILAHKAQAHESHNGQAQKHQHQSKAQVNQGIPPGIFGDAEAFGDGAGSAGRAAVPQIHKECRHRRQEQHHADDGTAGEVHHADDLPVHIHRQGHGGAAGHQGYAVVRKHHGEHRQHRRDDGAAHIGQSDGGKLVPLGKSQHPGGLIDGEILILERIVEHEEGHREGVEDGTDDNALVAVQADVQVQQVGNQAVVTEQQHQSHAVGDAGNEHGQGEEHHKHGFIPDAAAVEGKGQGKCQSHGNAGGAEGGNQGVFQHGEKLG